MRAIWNGRYGPPANLTLRDIGTPAPGKGQVLLRVLACGANTSDIELITGRPAYARVYGLTRPRVHVPGSDVADIVEAVGPGCTRFQVGDTVFGDVFDTFGGFAEKVAAPEARLIPIPDGLDPVTAAAIPQAGVIALQATRQVKPGMRVLINGGGGGMGSFAVQLAHASGAHVTAVDSTDKAAMMQGLGADTVIDYRQTDFTRTGDRWDLILDLFATHRAGAIRRALAPGGQYMMVGGRMSALVSVLTAGTLMSLGRRKIRMLAARQSTEDLADIAARVVSGTITAALDDTVTLDQMPDALGRLARGQVHGKLVMRAA